MARRKKTSTADNQLELVAMLPWWAGVLLALVSYFVLHNIASQPVVAPTQPGQMGAMAAQSLWKSLATVGQYIIPFIFLLGAATSAWRLRERKNLVADVARSQATDALDGMSWREFEMLVGEGFRLQGYQVVETGGGDADGGVDLVLTRRASNLVHRYPGEIKHLAGLAAQDFASATLVVATGLGSRQSCCTRGAHSLIRRSPSDKSVKDLPIDLEVSEPYFRVVPSSASAVAWAANRPYLVGC